MLIQQLGYKVGRVDQSETALGAEMRMAKSKGKPTDDKGREKIVRRYVVTDVNFELELIYQQRAQQSLHQRHPRR